MFRGMLGFFKLASSLLLLPLAYAVSLSFHDELLRLKSLSHLFGWGGVIYVIWHIFIFSLLTAYQLGLKGFAQILSFSSFFSEWIPRIIPLGTLVLSFLYYILGVFINLRQVTPSFIFLLGFTFAAHIILSAQDLYSNDEEVLKTHYFFSMVLTYVAGLVLLAALIGMNFSSFSFNSFWDQSWQLAQRIYHFLYTKFLLLR